MAWWSEPKACRQRVHLKYKHRQERLDEQPASAGNMNEAAADVIVG